ncbi:MAG: histidine kinase, partial [Flavobacteriales bacterium]
YSKKNLITIKEEMAIVEDYLSLEKIRYEERLQVNMMIEDKSLSVLIPPLLLQTITENAIKHGVSKLMSGGTISYEIRIIDDYLSVIVSNTGKLDDSHESDTGIGVKNTVKRLKLIYGSDATFDLRQVGEEVKSEILILLNKPNENNNSR